MEILMIFVAGIIISVSVYLVLSKSLIRIIIVTTLLSYGVHLMLLSMGGLNRGALTIEEYGIKSNVVPLPHVLILSAIDISFAVTSFFLVLDFRSYKELGTDNLEEMKEVPKDDK